MSELHQFKPPFIVYDNFVEIGDEDGHVCTAENPDIAKAIVIALNSHADLVAALEAAEEYISVDTDIPAADAVLVQIRIALAEAKGGSQS